MNRQERDPYMGQARRAGLEKFAERSWVLYERAPFEEAPIQGAADIVEAYVQARRLVSNFETLLQRCEADLKHLGLEVEHRARPGGVKDANRAIEKMGGRNKVLPLDLLGGTLICPSLDAMYRAAAAVMEDDSLHVVSFRDRCIVPVASGYRDLQLSVQLGDGHLAELKIMHRIFSDLDRYEHKLFELQRGIEAAHRDEMPFVEELVVKSLTKASERMYSKAWKQVLNSEGLTPRRRRKR